MGEADNPGRERILQRIRAGVRVPAVEHGEARREGAIFPPVPDLLLRFQQECAGNITECVLTRDRTDSAAAIARILASLPAGELYAQDATELRGIAAQFANGRSLRWSSEGPPAEASQATLTLAHALVASTASILVSSLCGGRGASVVAPCHIVLAHCEQMVPDLEAALALAVREGWATSASFLGLVTGSSRTADIEKLLVIGAHGPRRLVVVLETGPGAQA